MGIPPNSMSRLSHAIYRYHCRASVARARYIIMVIEGVEEEGPGPNRDNGLRQRPGDRRIGKHFCPGDRSGGWSGMRVCVIR